MSNAADFKHQAKLLVSDINPHTNMWGLCKPCKQLSAAHVSLATLLILVAIKIHLVFFFVGASCGGGTPVYKGYAGLRQDCPCLNEQNVP